VDGRRLNVLYVSRGYTTHDRRFLGSFVGAGWSPTHLPLTHERLEMRSLPEGVNMIDWGEDAMPSSRREWTTRIRQMKSVIDAMKPDVVIAGPVQGGALIAALAGAKPLVTVSWGTDVLVDADRSELCRHATRRALEASALVFGDCLAVRNAVKEHGGPPDDRIVTFPWGIDLDRFHPGASSLDLREKLGWQGSEIFISTRSWEPVYAIDVLLKAFLLLYEKRPSVRLVLLGDGSLSSEIRETIGALGISSLVHAPGRIGQSELPEWFRLADAYVSSALSDGTSVSLLEAMASGLPAVVSESFGNLEWVKPGVNGSLAVAGDAESLAAAMESVVDNRQRDSQMGSTNIEMARDKANWNNNFPELVHAVERIVAE
jgi:glycosyltransferase involved in cell wall biosynthesis